VKKILKVLIILTKFAMYVSRLAVLTIFCSNISIKDLDTQPDGTLFFLIFMYLLER